MKDRATLDLTRDEFVALVAIIGCGMNAYLGRPLGKHEEAVEQCPQEVIDRLTGKLNTALTKLLEST